jgi:hypothetical protein
MQQIALQEVVRQRRRRRRLQPRAAAAPKRGKGPGVAVVGEETQVKKLNYRQIGHCKNRKERRWLLYITAKRRS